MSEDRPEYIAPSPVCQIDFDNATWLGDDDDGCYYDAARGPGGWYLTVLSDSSTTHSFETVLQDDGPYITRAAALEAARNIALDWCHDNAVEACP